ncbi:MAG TPA: helix-turn-helix domain-containing protein [Actinomycetes bacterium]|jgi:DNA-binding HxlR family transcriptional regulator|nr:helix-turn-helix domain-containing protein [Actinomycetes bacterium]
MLGRNYETQVCSIARTLEIVGERWTLLIVRDALLGLRRFEDFQESLGVARNVLADRLRRLVEHGILERVRYQERPERFEYQLTERGQELSTAVLALMHWGDRYLAGPAGPPRLTEHTGCGGSVVERHVCSRCGRVLEAGEVAVLPGPALTAATRPAG